MLIDPEGSRVSSIVKLRSEAPVLVTYTPCGPTEPFCSTKLSLPVSSVEAMPVLPPWQVSVVSPANATALPGPAVPRRDTLPSPPASRRDTQAAIAEVGASATAPTVPPSPARAAALKMLVPSNERRPRPIETLDMLASFDAAPTYPGSRWYLNDPVSLLFSQVRDSPSTDLGNRKDNRRIYCVHDYR